MSLTNIRASLEALRGPVGDEGEDSEGEVFDNLEKVDRRGREVLSGREDEDMNGAASSVWPLEVLRGRCMLGLSLRYLLQARQNARCPTLSATWFSRSNG